MVPTLATVSFADDETAPVIDDSTILSDEHAVMANTGRLPDTVYHQNVNLPQPMMP